MFRLVVIIMLVRILPVIIKIPSVKSGVRVQIPIQIQIPIPISEIEISGFVQ